MANNNGELTYFIKCHSFVKIGKTTELKRRLDTLQAANPYNLELIGVTFHPEPTLHNKFEHLKARNEWYHLTKELKEYIAKYAAVPEIETYNDFEIAKKLQAVPENIGGKTYSERVAAKAIKMVPDTYEEYIEYDKAVQKAMANWEPVKDFIYDVIKELQKKGGVALLDDILKEGLDAEIKKDDIELALVQLIRDAEVFQPNRKLQEYKITRSLMLGK